MLKNKLGINNSAELARKGEQISKAKAVDLFENELLKTFEVGTFKGLAQIHFVKAMDVVQEFG